MKTTEQIQRDVVDELAWDPAVDSSHVAVTVEDRGVVTLAGAVPTYAQGRAAAAATRAIQGVTAVVNLLEVVPPDRMKKSDTTLAEACVRALAWSSSVPDGMAKVTVSRGWITLEGEAEWDFQRRAATNALHDLTGVRGVTDRMTVKPRIEATQVRERINAAFRRAAEIDAGHVRVEVSGREIALTGWVSSWAERDAAERAAWAAPGVSKVENDLEVRIRALT